jgi:hypothetical protein
MREQVNKRLAYERKASLGLAAFGDGVKTPLKEGGVGRPTGRAGSRLTSDRVRTANLFFHAKQLVELSQRREVRNDDSLLRDLHVSAITKLLDHALDRIDVEPDPARELEGRNGDRHAFVGGRRRAERRMSVFTTRDG